MCKHISLQLLTDGYSTGDFIGLNKAVSWFIKLWYRC